MEQRRLRTKHRASYFKARQLSRRQQITKICQKHRLHSHYIGNKSNFRNGRPTHCPTRRCPIFVDTLHKVFFCFIPKVASTSVKSLFSNLLNISSAKHLNQSALHIEFNERVLRVGPSHFSSRFLNNYTKAIFVRHPFARLVSAYEDKANRSKTDAPYFYALYWDQILNGSSSQTLTFVQFVDYLLGTPVSEWDEHWAPYYSRCEPCLVQYDLIGKLETSDDDFELLYRRLGLEYDREPAARINRGRKAGKLNITSYFASLTRQQVLGLYNRLFFDFELFGYNIKDFIT